MLHFCITEGPIFAEFAPSALHRFGAPAFLLWYATHRGLQRPGAPMGRRFHLLTSTALTASAVVASGSALAADFRMPVKAPPLVVPFSWTGCYAGVNFGGLSHRLRHRLDVPAGTDNLAQTFESGGQRNPSSSSAARLDATINSARIGSSASRVTSISRTRGATAVSTFLAAVRTRSDRRARGCVGCRPCAAALDRPGVVPFSTSPAAWRSARWSRPLPRRHSWTSPRLSTAPSRRPALEAWSESASSTRSPTGFGEDGIPAFRAWQCRLHRDGGLAYDFASDLERLGESERRHLPGRHQLQIPSIAWIAVSELRDAASIMRRGFPRAGAYSASRLVRSISTLAAVVKASN